MLIIREKQLHRLAVAMLANRLRAYFLTHHADAVSAQGHDQLTQLITEGIQRAQEYGFRWESSIGWFLATMLEVSPRFDSQPHIRALLENTNHAETRKIDEVLLGTSERDWLEAELL